MKGERQGKERGGFVMAAKGVDAPCAISFQVVLFFICKLDTDYIALCYRNFYRDIYLC